MKKKLISICLFLSLLLPIFSSDNESQEFEKLTVDGVDLYRRFIAYGLLSEKNKERLAFATDNSLREILVNISKDDVIQLASGEFSIPEIGDVMTVEFIDDNNSTDVSELVFDKLQNGYSFGEKLILDISEQYIDDNNLPLIAYLPLCYYVKEFITKDKVVDELNVFNYGIFYLKEGKLYLEVSNFVKE